MIPAPRCLHRISFLLAASCAVALAQPFLYVANQNSNTISVVNTRDNTVAPPVFASFSPAGLALSPDGTRLYATNPNGNLVVVYNTANNAVVTTFAIGQLPQGIAADATRIYVTLQGNAALAVYSAATFQLQTTLRVGFGPAAVAVATATNRVYVINTYSSTLSTIDPTRIGTNLNPVLSTLPMPNSPVSLALSANGQTAWVVSSAIPTLARVNLTTGAVEDRLALPVSPAGIALSDDNTRAYIPGYGPKLATVDLQRNSVLRSTDLPPCPAPRCLAMAAAVSADGKLVYVANTSLNQIALVNADTGELSATRINVQQSPRAIVLGPAPRPTPSNAVTN